ncbi:ABC transporter ATP-binding protein [Aurantimonas sp. Leaf443]|uniref:ABC transporter ATP-binding protein n=1 Tax=Aurantimonas sp. Leaf443 TaxID=1736378 RepID=UPI0006FC65C7|nr:ABC transporter ATP-binding protein [Aurantimonas sp. Leaf443]KQT86128.1 ABC transporter ATP-binding protein [Aurantimonas sp. Leaf443]
MEAPISPRYFADPRYEPNPAPLLSIEDLSVEFLSMAGRIRAVNGLTMQILPGRTVALVGESGSGKSVTSQAILGILPRAASITGGRILLRERGREDVDLATLPPRGDAFRALRGDRISIVFQEPMTSFSPLHTLEDQIGEVLEVHGKTRGAETRERVLDILKLVRFPEPKRALKSYPFELSGGLRQRAMIAMALICRPALLIADEPTTALDVTLQAQILKLIRQMQDELSMAVLLITHDLGVVANLAEDVVVMHHGKVVESGPIRSLFQNPQHPYLKSLMAAVPDIDPAVRPRLKPIREIKVMPDALFRRDLSGKAGDPLLDVRHLEKTFTRRGDRSLLSAAPKKTVKALRDVSISVRRGECLGIVGESGSGKTTLARAIMRAVPVDSGTITYHAEPGPVDVRHCDRRTLFDLRARMQYVFQDPFSSLDPRMTVGAILAEPFEIHEMKGRGNVRERVERLLLAVGLEPSYANRYPHSFSGGQRQRIGIARALALEPEMLICDEPVAALDVSVQAQILNLLKDLQRQCGLTYLFISHNLAVINYMADRIAVMCDGEVVEIATRERLFERAIHPYTQMLMRSVPHLDLDKPLDFDAIGPMGEIGERNWPAPFDPGSGGVLPLVEIESGHFVRIAGAHALDGASAAGGRG